MKPNDLPFHKIYREFTSLVLPGWKTTQQGYAVTDQSDTTGEYTVASKGDEVGWIFWPAVEEGAREIGAWAQNFVVVVGASDSVRPISATLGADTRFEAKTLVLVDTAGDNSKIRVVSGSMPGAGEFGIVFSGSEDDEYSLLFIALSSSVLRVDHAGSPDTSTIVYDVLADDTINPINFGYLSDFLRNFDGVTNLLTSAKFNNGADSKVGPINFSTTNYPTLSPPEETPYTVETNLGFDAASGKWRFWTQIGGGGASKILARVAFRLSNEVDESLCEICSWDEDLKEFVRSETIGFVDSVGSRFTAETLGDATIFVVDKILDEFTVAGETRSRYRVSDVYEDAGTKLTHVKASFYVNEAQGANSPEWWLAEPISTTIAGFAYKNFIPIRIPDEWEIRVEDPEQILEKNGASCSWPISFRPIEPVPDGSEDIRQYESYQQLNEVAICKYRRKS